MVPSSSLRKRAASVPSLHVLSVQRKVGERGEVHVVKNVVSITFYCTCSEAHANTCTSTFRDKDGIIHKISANLPAQGQARATWRWYRPASTGCWSDPTKLRWADWWRWYAPVFLSPSRLMRGFLASDDSLEVDAIAIVFLRCWSFGKKDCFDRLDDQFVRWNSSTFDGCLSNYILLRRRH